MRVAMILNSFPEISEKFLVNQIIGLVRAGIDLKVFAAHRAGTDKRHDAYVENNVEAYTTFLDIPRSMKARILCVPKMFFMLMCKNPKAAFEALRFRKYRTVAKNFKLLWFGNEFAGKHFDIVHCQFGMNGLIGVYLKECGFCDSVVTSFHGSDINSYPKRHGFDVYRTLYAKGDLITSNTNFTKTKIVANGCDSSMIRILPACLMAEEYLGIDRSRVLPDTVLTVGRLEEKKGHRYAIEAIAKIRKSRPNIQYFIAGDGSFLPELKRYAEELDVSDCCHFLGLCTSSAVRDLYASCSVFTLPSVTAANGDMEGQGLVLQEAQLCGLPVVSTWHNGIPDGLIDGVTGFLVPERDSDALAARLLELLSEERLRDKMGVAGRKFVVQKYDIVTNAKDLMGFYDEIPK